MSGIDVTSMLKANDGMIEVVRNAQKKQKTQHISGVSPYFETIAMKLWEQQRDLRKNYDDAKLETIEIEVRVGMILDNYRRWKSKVVTKGVTVVDPRANPNLRFRAGIDQVFARKLRTKLANFHSEQLPLQILRCDAEDNRWTVSTDGTVLMSERKQAIDQVNLALVAHDYDVRVNVATETPDPVLAAGVEGSVVTGPVINRAAWLVERRKRRTCYTIRDAAMSKWRIDYTEVDVVERNPATGLLSKPKKEVEVEFEVVREALLPWLKERDGPASIEKTRVLAEQLVRLLDYCIPFESEAERETSLEALRDPHFDYEIGALNSLLTGKPVQSRQEVERLHRSRHGGAFDFLGAMPVNLTRQNLLEVQSSDYFITEKSDGVRYLLYTVPDPASRAGELTAVLADRSKAVFKFRGSDLVGRALGPGCILDGELVYNRSFRENIFLVFDVLLWRSAPLIDQPFAERLDRISRDVLPQYARNMSQLTNAAALETGSNPSANPNPLQLVRKAFVSKKELGTLLGKMRLEDGERVFFDGENGAAQSRRHHKSDGFIFQPNMRYVFSKHYELLKWKWPELRSIDLQVHIPLEEGAGGVGNGSGANRQEWPIYLMCGGPDGTQINCTKRGDTNVGLGEFDAYRLLADMESPEMAAKGGNAVVEVAYDIQVGMWAYLHLRKDKNQPNFIDSVLGVFTEQAEAISIEELQYSLIAAAHSAQGLRSDFDAQVGKMKEKLLAWQRAEAAKLSSSSGGASSASGASGALQGRK